MNEKARVVDDTGFMERYGRISIYLPTPLLLSKFSDSGICSI